MAEIDVADAAMAGVRLTFRRPLTVIIWGALVVGYIGLLLALFGAGMVNSVIALVKNGAAEPTPQLVLAMIGSLFGFITLMAFGLMIIGTVVIAAAFRAELEPARGSFAYMRLGGQELWVLGVNIVLTIILFVVRLVLGIPVTIIAIATGFQAAAAGGFPSGPAGAFGAFSGMNSLSLLGQLIIVAVVIWLWCRLAPGIVMSYRERQFRLFESWNLTKGHAWRIFLAMLLVWLIMIALFLVAYVVIGAVVVGTVLTIPGITDPTTFFSRPIGDWIAIFGPTAMVAALLFVVLGGVSIALRYAALARIYAQLQPPAEVAETFA